jgi:hypothetical protein
LCRYTIHYDFTTFWFFCHHQVITQFYIYLQLICCSSLHWPMFLLWGVFFICTNNCVDEEESGPIWHCKATHKGGHWCNRKIPLGTGEMMMHP